MADNVLNLQIKVNTDTGQISVMGQELQKLGSTAAGAGESFMGLSGEAAGLAKSLAGLVSLTALISFMKSSVEEAEQETQVLGRLKFAIEAAGQSWKTHSKDVQDWGNEIQRSTRFSDTEAYESLARLARVTQDVSQAQRASQIAMGLSVASGKSLAETTEQVSQIVYGQERALAQARREFGNLIGGATSAQGIMDALAVTVGHAAFSEDSLTKNTKQMKSAFDDLKKTIGNDVTPVISKLVSWTTEAISVFKLLYITITSNMRVIGAVASTAFHLMKDAAHLSFTQMAVDAAAFRVKVAGIMTDSAADIIKTWKQLEDGAKQSVEKTGPVIAGLGAQQEKIAREITQQIGSVFNDLNKQSSDAFAKMVIEGQNFEQAMQQVARNFAESFISAITQIIIKLLVLKAIESSAFGPVGLIGGGGFFAAGAERVVTRPTMFVAGEGGPERVSVRPLGGESGSGGGSNISVGDIHVTVELASLDARSADTVLNALAQQLRNKTGSAIRFALASDAAAGNNARASA